MSASQKRRLRLIVNGKAVADPLLRPAVESVRQQGTELSVRVTWEAGDADHYAAEAEREGLDVIVAAGGDGTINEVVNGLLNETLTPRAAVAVIPYGTANDFATSCGIEKGNPMAALELAATGPAVPIDVGQVNDRFFINVASGGFGAEVTASTPPEMKKALGGAAYSLMGVVTAAKMNPYPCRVRLPNGEEHSGEVIVIAVGNGIQCGGGFPVTPQGVLNDGLLDLMVVHDVELPRFGKVLYELTNIGSADNEFVSYLQLDQFEFESERPMQLNLDGEPLVDQLFRFRVLPQCLNFVLPPGAPVV